MEAPKPTTAFVGTHYVGTDRLDRGLTDPENAALAKHLRAHDFVGASSVSLRFAFTLRRNKPAAQDLQSRANLRLVRRGWDSALVTLVKCMCRFVWSEHKHEIRETAVTRRAEETFLAEQAVHAPSFTPSAEDQGFTLQSEHDEDVRAHRRLALLEEAFTRAEDTVNLLWLGFMRDGVGDIAEMARRSGRDPREFYRAGDRRKRHVERLLAESPPGAPVLAAMTAETQEKT